MLSNNIISKNILIKNINSTQTTLNYVEEIRETETL